MFHWSGFTLFLYVVMRMSGFVLFSPIFGRNGIPRFFQGGLIGLMSITVYFAYGGDAAVPDNLIIFGFRLLSELLVGLVLAFIMRFFFYIVEQAGEITDTQMGMSMAKNYDPSSQSSMTNTANMLNALMLILFFIANGHVTLLRLMLTSGEIVPYGRAVLNPFVMDRTVELFTECVLLAVKLALPVLGASLLGQVGMGVLMKVIPQINVFAINIELKIIIGLVMLIALLSPMSDFLLQAESDMLRSMREVLEMMN